MKKLKGANSPEPFIRKTEHCKLKRSKERFHMTSNPPYPCPKTMKRRPCWCYKPVLWDGSLTFFLCINFLFFAINLHSC